MLRSQTTDREWAGYLMASLCRLRGSCKDDVAPRTLQRSWKVKKSRCGVQYKARLGRHFSLARISFYSLLTWTRPMPRYMFDIIYVTWFVHVGTAFLGGWVWWIWTIVSREGTPRCSFQRVLTVQLAIKDPPIRNIRCIQQDCGPLLARWERSASRGLLGFRRSLDRPPKCESGRRRC